MPGLGAFPAAIAAGLAQAALVFWGLEFFRQMLRSGGLCEAHFRWHESRMRLFRRHLVWFIPTVLPLVIALRALTVHGYVPWGFALDRLLFIAVLLTTTVFLWRTLSLRNGALAPAVGGRDASVLGRHRYVWFVLAVGTPLALVCLGIAGYHFTALELLYRFEGSVATVFAAALVYALAVRWMLLAKRRLGMAQAKARLAAAKEAKATEVVGEEAAREGVPPIIEERVNLASVDAQSRKLLRGVLAALVLVAFWGIWADVLPALGVLDDVELWKDKVEVSSVVNGRTVTDEKLVPISLADILLALLVLVITFAAARNIPGLLELSLLQRMNIHAGERHAVTTLVRYFIVGVGVVGSFAAVGIGWGKVQWLVAAISVGLGFGLQEIFANFVSGIIILFERPIRVGDLVTVSGIDGYVTRIRMRATTITDFDRKELIVPNKEFVTASLVNWTLTDPITRVILNVGIAYGSDVTLARNLLLQAARENALVLDEPGPSALFLGFGASSLDFQLRVFIGTRDVWPQLQDSLHTSIDSAFRNANIEIAFPQQDIHIRSADGLVGLRAEPESWSKDATKG